MRHGFLLIDKPTGPTSHDVVDRVRDRLSEKNAGHVGTLDPAASGLLVLAVGAKALKVVEFFSGLSKEYEAQVTLGAISSTYDAQGMIEEVKPKAGWPVPDEIAIRRAIESRFLGKIQQTPPAHSAVHINGRRAYELARQGKSVAMPSREVELSACDVVSYAFPIITLRVACSSGTYIRSLANDLGDALGFGGYLSALRRTKVGEWNVKDACPPSDAAWSRVIPLKDVMKNFHGIEVTEKEAEDIRFGRSIKHEVKTDTFAWFDGLPIAVLVPSKDGSRTAHPRKVL